MRNYHRKYNEEEEYLISFEFELRKTVSDHRADECLNERGRKRKEEGIEKSAEIMVLNYEEFPRVRCRVLGDELEESSYVDGYGVFKTFIKIILPLSVPMLITVFILSFSWQWTDIFYTNTFLNASEHTLLTSNSFWQRLPASLEEISTQAGAYVETFEVAVKNTAGMLIILPLIIMYLFCQRYLIQGIEHSGFGGM